MHPIIINEITRLQVESMVSSARLARLARRAASRDAAAPPRGRRVRRLRGRVPRITTTNA